MPRINDHATEEQGGHPLWNNSDMYHLNETLCDIAENARLTAELVDERKWAKSYMESYEAEKAKRETAEREVVRLKKDRVKRQAGWDTDWLDKQTLTEELAVMRRAIELHDMRLAICAWEFQDYIDLARAEQVPVEPGKKGEDDDKSQC